MTVLISIIIIAVLILLVIKFGWLSLSSLTKSNKIHLTIISIINLVIIGELVSVARDGNDKAIILVIFGFLTLIVLNGFVWLILRILNRPEFDIYRITTLVLTALFIPTLILASLTA